MTLQEVLISGKQKLMAADIADAATDAWLLLAMVCKIDRNYFYAHLQEELGEEQHADYRIAVEKRAEHIPLQYITGEQEFMGCVIKVNSGVLIPRMETEILVTEALKDLTPGMSVLDLCTGSGCIMISLMKHLDGLKGYASDISKQALKLAKENAKLNETAIIFQQGDLFARATEQFDMIISNPPYIPTADLQDLMTEVRDFEPHVALDGGADGYDFYRRIIKEAPGYLKEGGYLYMETGYNQGDLVAGMMRAAGFVQVVVIKDLQGLDRVVRGKLQEEKDV
ncbi:MAG: peptide chain release factor N(5)-glutamine methyltransferase [Eubacterium sp.]|nr:peptide chain release factor N(5)-glutamine methyltransferase [Eubacterium sp.]